MYFSHKGFVASQRVCVIMFVRKARTDTLGSLLPTRTPTPQTLECHRARACCLNLDSAAHVIL